MTTVDSQANANQQRLAAARQKLIAPHVPALLRITAFLRLSCATLDTPGAYPQLMQALAQYNKEWWTACDISPDGMLYSLDPEIYWLLEPVLQLHAQPLAIAQKSPDRNFAALEAV